MRTPSRLLICVVLVFSLLRQATAQDNNATNAQRATVAITASASGGHVRFTAPSSIVQTRLEVYNSAGKKVFDNEVRGGNVLDWQLQDGQAERLADDTYLCVVTVKSLSGKISERIGLVTVEKSSASVRSVDESRITAQQSQAIGPLEENASLIALKEDDGQTTTVIAHNGDDGQITRGKGALSFRIGDFFSGKDTEQMRLTAEGNVGIGIAHPQARLDVDGLIRATQGIVFPDGSVQFSASRRTFGPASQKPGQFGKKPSSGNDDFEAQATMSTQDRLAKWIDNAGTLGDSAIVDVNGNIGIGTTSPQSGLDYRNAGAPLFTRDLPANPGNAVSALQLGLSNVGSRNAGVGPSFLFFGENSAGAKSFLGRVSGVWENPSAGAEAGAIFFQVRANSADVNALTERMRIASNGNVGIGTTGPISKLHILSGPSNLPPRLQSAGSANFGTSFAAGWDFYHGTIGKAYVGVPDAAAGLGAGELIMFGGVGTATSLWANSNRTMTLDTGGKVGIGTATPQSKLDVRGSLTLDSGSNPGLFTGTGNTELNRYLWLLNSPTLATASGLKAGGILIADDYNYANPGKNELIVKGNARQSLDSGGLVKAMIFVLENGTIDHCYNGFTGESVIGGTTNTGCGFTVTKMNSFLGPIDNVDFGFELARRFWSVTASGNTSGGGQPFNIGINANGSNHTLIVSPFYTTEPENHTSVRYMAIIY